ncbi:hypothetical protein GGR55DRAFT_112123 [Xylaria sp. FL0064]|nr:hypothetical protein GGR55DRAFT_112123 [Xylaria sp. FL0064]
MVVDNSLGWFGTVDISHAIPKCRTSSLYISWTSSNKKISRISELASLDQLSHYNNIAIHNLVNMAKSAVKIGVYIRNGSQLLDLACIDVFHMMSKEYLSILPMLPKHIPDLAPSVEILYITAPELKSETVPLTASLNVRATHDIRDAEVQPGKLDIMLVPGPDPSDSWEKPILDFLKAHSECQTTDVLSVCTGIYLCGAAGLLDGRTACGPRGLQDDIKKKHPTAKLVGEKYRWVQDGNF